MFTKSTLRALKTFFNLQSLFHSGPYKWESHGGPLIRISKSRFVWAFVIVSNIWFVIRVLYIPLATIHGVFAGIPRNQLAVQLMLSQFYGNVGLYQLNMFLHLDEIKGLVNFLLYFNRKTVGEWLQTVVHLGCS